MSTRNFGWGCLGFIVFLGLWTISLPIMLVKLSVPKWRRMTNAEFFRDKIR